MNFIESRRACHSRACYKLHSHPTFSLGAVDAGSSVFTGATGDTWSLRPGMMVFIPAGAVHSCNPLPDQYWSYQMLHIDDVWLRTLVTEIHGFSGSLMSDDIVRVTADDNLYRRFCELNATLFSTANVEDKNVALNEFIIGCTYDTCVANSSPVLPPAVKRTLKNATNMMQQTERQPWTLTELANLSGMSRYQFIRAFRAETGMTPHAYQLNVRINQARRWLQAGHDMADIAYRLGFADQSHFQRVFKAHTGVTPGCYRS